MGYTFQEPSELAAGVLAAAIAEERSATALATLGLGFTVELSELVVLLTFAARLP